MPEARADDWIASGFSLNMPFSGPSVHLINLSQKQGMRMGSKSSSMLQDAEIQQISDQTGFLPSQIEKLYTRFSHLNQSNDGLLTKSDLMSIPELAYNPLGERIVQIFFAERCEPNNFEEERIDFRRFIQVLATFRATKTTNNENNHETLAGGAGSRLGHTTHPDKKATTTTDDSRRDRLTFVFNVYDVDNDGLISFRDLRNILKMIVGNHIEELQLDKIATRAFVEVDEDSDGFIDFAEFCRIFTGKDLDDMLRVNFW